MKNQSGFTIVESLIASAIIISSALAFSGSLYYFTKARQKAAAVSASVALAEVLDMSVKESERASNLGFKDANNLSVTLTSANLPAPTQITITNGTTNSNCFKPDLSSCDCSGFGKNCPVKLQTQMRIIGSEKRWAYRISTSPELIDMPSIGSSQFTMVSSGGEFGDADFTQEIGREVRSTGETTKCDPATTIGASGFNRTSGELVCLKKPLDSSKFCADGTIPKKVVVEASPDGRPLSVKLECSNRFQTMSCSDPYYLLQSLNVASMEPGQAKTGSCVFAGAESAVYKTTIKDGSSGRIWGRVCPAFYKSVSTCSVKSISANPGTCRQEVATPMESTYTSPDGKQTCTQKWTEYSWGGTVQKAAPTDFTALTTNYGGNVDCQVNVPAQDCSPTMGPRGVTASSWTAYVEVNVKCELEDAYKGLKAVN